MALGLRAVAVDHHDTVYFTRPDFSGISKLDASGEMSSVLEIPPDQHSSEGLAVSATGALLFSDPRSNRIYRVEPGGAADAIAGLGFGRHTGEGGFPTDANLQFPQSVALDRLGNLYS